MGGLKGAVRTAELSRGQSKRQALGTSAAYPGLWQFRGTVCGEPPSSRHGNGGGQRAQLVCVARPGPDGSVRGWVTREGERGPRFGARTGSGKGPGGAGTSWNAPFLGRAPGAAVRSPCLSARGLFLVHPHECGRRLPGPPSPACLGQGPAQVDAGVGGARQPRGAGRTLAQRSSRLIL